jgi:hypothetical protein
MNVLGVAFGYGFNNQKQLFCEIVKITNFATIMANKHNYIYNICWVFYGNNYY